MKENPLRKEVRDTEAPEAGTHAQLFVLKAFILHQHECVNQPRLQAICDVNSLHNIPS